MGYSVAKNTSFLTIASIGQKAVSFIYFIVIARLIGVENTGQYFFALSFTSIFAVIADFGFASVLTREMSKNPQNANNLFSVAFGGKIIFGICAYILVFIFSNVLNYSVEMRQLIYLAGLTMWFDNLHALFYAVFRAKRNLKYEAFGLFASQLITLMIGSIALYYHLPLIWLIIAYAIPSFLNIFYSGFFAVRVFKIKLKIVFNKVDYKKFLHMAWPFALAGIIGRLYAYNDTLLMSKMLTARELGWWSIPYKITFAFQFVPLALSASIYPVFSSLFATNKDAIGKLFVKSWRYLFIIIFPLSAGVIAIADQFVISLYGADYMPSILPLRILMISLIFAYLALITGALLNAVGEQKKQTLLMAIALVVSVFSNIILIPRFGINGAAISVLISNIILWGAGFILVSRRINLSMTTLMAYGLRAAIPAFVMGFAVYILSIYFNFIIAIPVGVILYFGLLFLSKGLSKNLLIDIKNKLINK